MSTNQIIPDTTDIRVATLAAALALVEMKTPGGSSTTKTLDSYIDDFEKAYKAVHAAVTSGGTKTSKTPS